MRYHKFLRYSTYRRYGIFIITIFFSRYGLQAWVNNKNIDLQISQTHAEIDRISQETAFIEQYYNKYLQGEYAPYFMGHEQGVLYRGEYIVRLKHQIEEQEAPLPDRDTQDENIILSTPQESRNYFIDQKLHFLKDWGIIQ